ncbi:hypothetical protein [Tenacibaculum maritimum]|uniref:hypothetical protein n=1 Tax=Tenacibaculum maritimum TaxID=107401 RepID=UPI00040C8B5C|nr:hypothetical protein [Tenacibaculum maritimum]
MANRLILTKEKFYQDLMSNTLGSSAIKIKGEIAINSSIIIWESRTIQNVLFQEKVFIHDVDIQFGLHFIDCIFQKGIAFKNVKNTKNSTNEDDRKGGISFRNCKAQFISFENLCEIKRGVVIDAKSEIRVIRCIQKTVFGNLGLKIKNSTVSELLDISNCNLELRINSSEVKTLRIESMKGDVSLINSIFTDWVKFWNVECPNNLTLNYNTFKKEFEVKASRIKGFYIHGDTFLRKSKLENRGDSEQNIHVHLDEIYITDANFVESFEFDGMGENLSKITLPLSLNAKGVLKIHNWKIKETLVSGVNQNLKLLFSMIGFKRLMLTNFSNFGVVNFDGITALNLDFKTINDPESSIIIANSILGLTRFSEFDFESFSFINLSFTSFDGIEASNVNWFSDNKLQINSQLPSSELDFRRKREIYRQIKQTLRSKGNQIDSLIFQAREMRTYREELKSSKNYSCSDRIIMTVNQTNGYGINWLKSLSLILLITFITYLITLPMFSGKITYALGNDFVSFEIYWNEFINKLSTLAQMFNPARKFSSTYGNNVTTTLYFLDLLHRIVLGILIFQLIRAFRRLASK